MPTMPAELVRAVKLLTMGEPFLAERTASIGLRRNPHNGNLHQVRGIARHRLCQFGGACADLETATLLVPLTPVASWALAESYMHMKKRGPAMTVIEGLLARSTRPPEIYRSMATALARWQEDDLALRVSEAWRTDVPTSAEAHFWCAIFLARTQHSPAVVLRELRQASRLDPDNISYRAQLAIALASIGRADQASDLLVRLDVGQVACPHLATRIARTFESAGQPNKALAWWTRSLNLTARGQSLAHEKRIGLEADPSEDPASGS